MSWKRGLIWTCDGLAYLVIGTVVLAGAGGAIWALLHAARAFIRYLTHDGIGLGQGILLGLAVWAAYSWLKMRARWREQAARQCVVCGKAAEVVGPGGALCGYHGRLLG